MDERTRSRLKEIRQAIEALEQRARSLDEAPGGTLRPVTARRGNSAFVPGIRLGWQGYIDELKRDFNALYRSLKADSEAAPRYLEMLVEKYREARRAIDRHHGRGRRRRSQFDSRAFR